MTATSQTVTPNHPLSRNEAMLPASAAGSARNALLFTLAMVLLWIAYLDMTPAKAPAPTFALHPTGDTVTISMVPSTEAASFHYAAAPRRMGVKAAAKWEKATLHSASHAANHLAESLKESAAREMGGDNE